MKWINVGDMTPADLETVICTYAFEEDEKWVAAGFIDNGKWYDCRDESCIIEVSHWIPLPKAIPLDIGGSLLYSEPDAEFPKY